MRAIRILVLFITLGLLQPLAAYDSKFCDIGPELCANKKVKKKKKKKARGLASTESAKPSDGFGFEDYIKSNALNPALALRTGDYQSAFVMPKQKLLSDAPEAPAETPAAAKGSEPQTPAPAPSGPAN